MEELNRIKKIRKMAKVSQDELAHAVGVSRQAISLYERGEREPKLATWKKIANFLGVTVPELQGIDEDLTIDDRKKRADMFATQAVSRIVAKKEEKTAYDLVELAQEFASQTIDPVKKSLVMQLIPIIMSDNVDYQMALSTVFGSLELLSSEDFIGLNGHIDDELAKGVAEDFYKAIKFIYVPSK